MLIRCCVANYFSRYNRIYTRIFAGPNEFGKFGCISFGIRIEGMVVVVESCFKFSFAQSDIVLRLIFLDYNLSPLNGDCRKKAIVYKASISTDSNDPPKSYYGCCETEFKSRFYNHR